MKLGYARISTPEQNLQRQLDELKAAGCEKIFQDTASGTKSKRPGLDQMLQEIRQGDTIVVNSLSRLGRSLKHLIELSESLDDKGVNLKILKDGIDTSSITGKMVFKLMAVFAEFERELIAERTKSGLAAARARGRKGGRPKGLSEDAKRKSEACKSLANSGMSMKEIAANQGISRQTVYNYLKNEI